MPTTGKEQREGLQHDLFNAYSPPMMNCTTKRPIQLAATLLLCLPLTMCKSGNETAGTDDTTKTEQASSLQKSAEKVIEADPNIELVEVLGDKIHIRNVFTQIGMELSFQEIIDGNYKAIQGGEAEAGNALKARDSGKMDEAKAHDSNDWGKTPEWVPRYPGLKINPNQIHGPKQDGSVWGQLSTTHEDDIKKISDYLIAEFKSSGLELNADMVKETTSVLVFRNQMPGQEQDGEKRQVTCSLSQQGGITHLLIQYAYGMESF